MKDKWRIQRPFPGGNSTHLIHKENVTAKPHTVGVLGKVRSYSRKRSVTVKVIAVEPGDNLSRGTLKTFIDGVGLSTVRFADPIG